MSTYQEIMYEMYTEGLIPLDEAGFFMTPTVKKEVNEIPMVTKKEFVSQVEPGDIVVAFTAKKTLKKYFSVKMAAKLMATIQGAPYTSSKIILDKNTIAGYGVVIRDTIGGSTIGQVPIDKYVRARTEACLIRVPELTDQQKKKVVSFVKKRMGLGYASNDMYKTIWDRFTRRTILPFFKDRELDPKQVDAIQEPLFCSTMITMAYLAAGFTKKFNNKHPYDVWPRDFLLADFTQKICRVEYKL